MNDSNDHPEQFWRGRRVCVTGGAGFVGKVLCKKLRMFGATVFIPRREQYDLTESNAVEQLYDDCHPDIVFHLAAEVGGIGANRAHPGRFFYTNMAMGLHLIEHARRVGIEKFIQVGTVCSYPKHTPVPFHEEDLWNGYPEETNAPYGIAKKSLLAMLQAYRAEYDLNGIFIMPVNLYGPGDNFDPANSHVIPALIRKFHEAVTTGADVVHCWGTGTPSREFLFVDDAAEALLSAGRVYNDPDPVNIGTGSEITIRELAQTIADLTHFTGRIEWDSSQPDGQPRRRLDVSRAERFLGWRARIDFPTGLERTIEWYHKNATQDASLTTTATPG